MFEKKNSEDLVSVIQYKGENDALVWKHPIENFTMGSQLIVHESQEAIFVRNGEALDLFAPGHYFLETQNLPLTSKIFKMPATGERIFQAEVYFVDRTVKMGIKWGTDSKVRLFDPLSGLHLELGACGEFNLRVEDSRKLIVKLVGSDKQFLSSQVYCSGGSTIQGYFKAMIMTMVKSYLAQTIKEEQINVLEIDEHLEKISLNLKQKINENIQEYGLEIPDFFVTRILTPDDDPNYKRMRQQYADQYLMVREEEIRRIETEAMAKRKMAEAEMEANLKIMRAQGEAQSVKIKGEAEAEAYKMQASAEAQEMKMKGYSYAEETARQVGVGAVQNGFGTIGEGSSSGTGADANVTGNASGGLMGDLLHLGIGMTAMSSVMGMTKDAISPMINNTQQMGDALGKVITGTWNCSCGMTGLTGKFCSNCGQPKGEIAHEENN